MSVAVIMGKPQNETYSEEEIAHRRDEALLRALSTPPKPHSAMKLGKRKAKVNREPSKPSHRRALQEKADEPSKGR